MDNANNEKRIKADTTLWDELKEYEILVPDYQRDYAQGRIDNGRIDNIREVFVEELFEALTSEDNSKTCHTGLVYGSYDEEHKVFIAVDGQQRLTTVFLLYWYVIWRKGFVDDNRYRDVLRKFKWATRSYSSQFVDLLFAIKNKDAQVVDILKQHIDYFSVWEKDPTVKSMLVMLGAIEGKYVEYGDRISVDSITENSNVKYDVLKLSKGSDGNTYVKMNSRGRQLTTFENFKAKLIDYMRIRGVMTESFTKYMDNEWADFMLQRTIKDGENENDDVLDEYYMYFINEYVYITTITSAGNDNDKECALFLKKKKDNDLDVPFISFKHYEQAFDTREKVEKFERTFNFIIKNYDEIKGVFEEQKFQGDEFYVDSVISRRTDANDYSYRAMFCALIKYAELSEYAEFDKCAYGKWHRVFHNLTENTSIGSNVIAHIREIVEQVDSADISEYISRENNALIDSKQGFYMPQVVEERVKATKMNDSSWYGKIADAEKTGFFNGAIRFLYRDVDGNVNWDHFDQKLSVAKNLKDKDGSSLKNLISNFTDWQSYTEIELNYDDDNWKSKILLNDKLIMPVHYLLMDDNGKGKDIDGHKYLREKLLGTDLIEFLLKKEKNNFCITDGNVIKISSGAKCRSGEYCFYIGKRNDVLSRLWNEGKIKSDMKVDGRDMFWGYDVLFSYREYLWRWNRPQNGKHFIFLMKDATTCETKEVTDNSTAEKQYYWHEVDYDDFTGVLDALINDFARSNESNG